jgi:hypothetical protein
LILVVVVVLGSTKGIYGGNSGSKCSFPFSRISLIHL